MPRIKIEKIVSFSSEDVVHVANNLLNNDVSKKWNCSSPGEKSASVVLQLEKASVISNIDIGNDNSAYIEVLVNRSSSTDDYKVLLVMSSFMTPLESRQSTNVNKVRMFTQDQLTKPECTEKWDRIKIICTQPFNRHVQYGLSFINLHSVENKLTSIPIKTSNLGKFTLRPDSPDNISPGSLFTNRKEKNEGNNILKAAAAIREASSSPNNIINKKNLVVKPLLKDLQNTKHAKRKNSDTNEDTLTSSRNRDEILYRDDKIRPNIKIDEIVHKKNEEVKKRKLECENESLKKNTPKKKMKNDNDKIDKQNNTNRTNLNTPDVKISKEDNKKENDNNDIKHNQKASSSNNKPKVVRNMKLFSQLLQGVTFVISGIQNPDRGNLRTMASDMGAKYRRDWDKDCTHLICAFMNTPKFNQVKGKGKIVTRKWLEDCHKERKKLPWRRYALDKSEKQMPESEDEIYELVDAISSPLSLNEGNFKSGSDTEDEIERIQTINKKPYSVYDQDTDTETQNEDFSNDIKIKEFPELFCGKKFYLDKDLSDKETSLLVQHITAYDGEIIYNLKDSLDIVITIEKNVEDLKNQKSDCKFITPDWIWKCHNEQKYISTDEYEM